MTELPQTTIIEPTAEQIESMREVAVATLTTGDQVFTPGMGQAYRTHEGGEIRFIGWHVQGTLWDILSNEEGTLVARSGELTQEYPSMGRLIRMGETRADPRQSEEASYRAFMAMPQREWIGLIGSLLSGGCLQPAEQLGFNRALDDRKGNHDG